MRNKVSQTLDRKRQDIQAENRNGLVRKKKHKHNLKFDWEMKSFCFEYITSIREKKSLSNYKYHHYLWQVSVEIEKKNTYTDNRLREKNAKEYNNHHSSLNDWWQRPANDAVSVRIKLQPIFVIKNCRFILYQFLKCCDTMRHFKSEWY